MNYSQNRPSYEIMTNPIKIKPIGHDQFEGLTQHNHLPRYYGGEIMAQAALACGQSVENDFVLHSLNCTFLKGGATDRPLIHQVIRLKEAKRFSVRQVNVMQDDCLVCTLILSYQLPEKGPEHQVSMPDVPLPDTLESDEQRFLKEAPPDLKKLNPLSLWPIEVREAYPAGMFHPKKQPPHSASWCKFKDTLDDDPILQQAMVTFISDTPLLTVAMRPHGLTYWAGNVQPASLSHYLWFHRPCRADEWLLFAMESPASCGGRGVAYSNIFNIDGQLVGTSMQEGVIRPV
jgi:acyl-CoA thioesterase-2